MPSRRLHYKYSKARASKRWGTGPKISDIHNKQFDQRTSDVSVYVHEDATRSGNNGSLKPVNISPVNARTPETEGTIEGSGVCNGSHPWYSLSRRAPAMEV